VGEANNCPKSNFLETATGVNQQLSGAHFVNIYGDPDTSVGKEIVHAVARPSVVCLTDYLSSVTLVHPIQPIEIFGNVSTSFGTLTIH